MIYRAILTLIALAFYTEASFGYKREYLPAIGVQPAVLNPQNVPNELYEKSYALVISNSAYEHWEKLPFSGTELDSVATALRKSGFDVLRLSDLDGSQMRNEINEFFQSYGRQRNSRIVFYYSGHGYLDKETDDGYLVPIDAQRQAPQSNLLVKAMPMEDVRNAAMRMPAINGLFIFDNCYSGMVFKSDGVAPKPEFRASSNVERWRVLRSGAQQRSRQFIAAGGRGELLPSKSPVAAAFVSGLEGAASISRDGYVTAAELAFYIQNNATTRMQNPRYLPLGGFTGDMVFQSIAPALDTEASKGVSPRPVVEVRPAISTQTRDEPTQKTVSAQTPGATFVDCPQCPEMVVVGRGSFILGSPDDEVGRTGRERIRRVQVERNYALGKFEVTVGDFKRFVSATGYVTDAERNLVKEGCLKFDESTGRSYEYYGGTNWKNPGFAQTDSHPVVCVSRNDAHAYVAWLTKYTKVTYRLPSEAEWEFAARSGSTSPYQWGMETKESCHNENVADSSSLGTRKIGFGGHVNCNDGYVYTAPKGSFQSNRFGINDMLGNVSELVEDGLHETNVGAPEDQSAWTDNIARGYYLVRGGSWRDGPDAIRSAYIGLGSATTRQDNLGFRVARNL